jgi:hypothetical protein
MEAPCPHGALSSKERDEDIPPPLIFNDIQRFSGESPMPAALAFIVISAPCQVRGRLQRKSRVRPTRQAQKDNENGLLRHEQKP